MSIVDHTSSDMRKRWSEEGLYDDQDLYTAFRAQAEARPDQIAVIDDSGQVTYGELLAATNRLANMLSAAGVGPLDVVAVQLPNRWECCAFDYAIAAVGAICLPFPINYREQELSKLMIRSRATAYITEDGFRDFDNVGTIDRLRPDLPDLRHVFVLGYRGGSDSSFVAVDPALAGGESAEWAPRDVDPNLPSRIGVTSGTESFPKMIVNSHNCTGRPYATLWSACGIGPSSRVLLGSPLGSGMGQIVTSAVLARLGATVAVTAMFSSGAALRLTERARPTHWWLVPTMVELILADPEFAQFDISSVEYVVCAGSPVSGHLVRKLDRDYGLQCLPTYGFVDGGLCSTRADDSLDRRAETVGRPDERVNEIRIVDESGATVSTNETGEIWSRGPFSPLGYLNSPELNERYRAEEGGWARSGDLGVMDGAGYLRVVGRIKDIIVRGGMNISAGEVEEHLVTHPAIMQAACVGYPDALMGERMCAFVVLWAGAEEPSVAEMSRYLKERGLMANKAPERLIAIDAMPTNPTGKILKRSLRERLAPPVPQA